MTDKQQIEEFATDLCKACRKSLKTCECKTPCVKAQIVSEALYNAGYRKVPENAVVLTREEINKISDDMYEQGKFDAVVALLHEEIAEVRKETAKEILTKWVDCDLCETGGYCVPYIRELAKQYGVEEE